jgi:N-acetylglucosamine-6-phosphate deacetylase
MLLIKGATIFTPTERLEGYDLFAVDGEIVRLEPQVEGGNHTDGMILDARGCYLAPGFIDLQINGGFGYDFTANPETIWKVGEGLLPFGVTSYLPTIVTSPLGTIAAAQEVLLHGRPRKYFGAQPLGLHVEGPFLNPERKGAHNSRHLRLPNLQDYTQISRESGVLLVTLAPELPGAAVVIQALTTRGVTVSAGHSMATYEEGINAFDQGIRYGTHIFNTMPPFTQFKPGLVGALLDDPRPCVGLIADGIHVHAAVVRAIWGSVGPQRLTLVTDAIAALGMPPGRYEIGDLQIIVTERTSRLENGILAGSILTMDTAIRNLIDMTGCTIGEALQTVTTNPAEVIKMSAHLGEIAVGKRADLVLLNQEMEVLATICAGKIGYQSIGLLSTA